MLWFFYQIEEAKQRSTTFKREDNDKPTYCSYNVKPTYNQTLSIQITKYETYNTTQQWYIYGCQYSSAVQLYAGDERIVPLLLCRNETQPSIRLPYATKLVISGNKRNALLELDLQLTTYKCGGIWPLAYYDNFVITQPDMKNYTGRLECAWAVWGHSGNSLTPPTFDETYEDFQVDVNLTTDFKGKCDEEYLIVYNGPNQNAPHLGRYCEQSSIASLVVTHGIFIEYITSNYNKNSVFSLSAHEGSGCGGILKYPYRQIVFDYQYKTNTECIWDLSTVNGFHLAAIFSDRFFIESSPNCTKDFLKIQQKSPEQKEWQTIATLCGRNRPEKINTTTTEMRLYFHSDDTIVGHGFTVDFERNCGGILYATDTMQELTSPNYPNEYPANLMCKYTIIPSPSLNKTESDSLYIRFTDFVLEDSPLNKCMFDNVTINIEDSVEEDHVLCGRKTNYEIRSPKNISIIFQSDGSYGRKGFRLEYGHDKCGAVITNSTIIESPTDSATQKYPHGSICTWKLQAPENYKIIIKFEYIDFESLGGCSYDAVEVYKGLNVVLNERLVQLCGNITGKMEIINIQQNTALIRSFSDDRDASRGFKALVKFIPNCDNHIYLGNNNFTYDFSRFSGQYANNLDCAWLFSTSPERQLRLEFNTFHVENSSNCMNDYLDVRDGSGMFADEIGRYCGHDLPTPVVSSKSTLLLRFVTDGQETSSGFIANIKAVPKICGQQSLDLTLQKMVTIASPDDGTGKYPNNINCIWKIKADKNIHLHFEKLDIEGPDANGSCSTDYIKIINSDDANVIDSGYGSQLVFNGDYQSGNYPSYDYAAEHIYCGVKTPDDYFTTSNGAFIKFRSNSAINKAGFKLKATVAEGCYRNFTGSQGRIKLAEATSQCDIFIKAPVNTTLSLYYNELYFSEYNCDKENIEVFDAHTNTSLQKLCEYIDTGKSLFSNTNELRIRLVLSGFYTQVDITYLASNNGPGCGGDFYNTKGLLTNPYYPEHVRNNSDCRWNIRVPANLKVLLKFNVFNMGAKSTCRTDYLQIIEHDDIDKGQEKVMRQFCGEDEPRYYLSTKNFVTVRFHKSVNYDGTGWVIAFSGVHPSIDTNYIF